MKNPERKILRDGASIILTALEPSPPPTPPLPPVYWISDNGDRVIDENSNHVLVV